MKSLLCSTILLGLFSSAIAASNPVTITDKSGRSISVTLVGLTGSTLKCKLAGRSKITSIPLANLNAHSTKLVKETIATSQADAAKNTPLNLDVSINKRRKKSNGSYYMKQMEVTAKITVKNKNLNVEANTCDGRFVIIGQDQKDTDQYEVLQNEQFKIKPSHTGQEHLAKTVRLRYDSDNKGSGNIGGSKYYGYILIITSSNGDILASKTTIHKAEDLMGPTVLQQLSKLAVEDKLEDTFEAYVGGY